MTEKHKISERSDKNQQNVLFLNNNTSNNLQEYMSDGLINPELIPYTGYGKVVITFVNGSIVDIKQEVSIKPSDIIKKYR